MRVPEARKRVSLLRGQGELRDTGNSGLAEGEPALFGSVASFSSLRTKLLLEGRD